MSLTPPHFLCNPMPKHPLNYKSPSQFIGSCKNNYVSYNFFKNESELLFCYTPVTVKVSFEYF